MARLCCASTRAARQQTAGLGPGDVITAVAGRPVKDLHHYHDALARHRIGETVEVSLWREGQTITLRTVLEESR